MRFKVLEFKVQRRKTQAERIGDYRFDISTDENFLRSLTKTIVTRRPNIDH
jgi:hypothetical protein